jgi:hypothetical protein
MSKWLSNLPPAADKIGHLITDPGIRASWLNLVSTLYRLSRPGEILHEFLFHGTTAERAESIKTRGVDATEVLMRDDNGQWWTKGTYWARPEIAAYYAEDYLQGADGQNIGLAILAIRRSDITTYGELVQDEQSLDWPICSRLGHDAATCHMIWQRESKRQSRWEASIAATGSLVCLGPVGPEHLVILHDLADLQQLMAQLNPGRAPGA